MLPYLEAVLNVRVGLVADALVLVQFQIVNAPVVRREGGDHLILPLSGFFLLQELFLQLDPVFQFFLLDPVRRVCRLFFQDQPGIPAVLRDDIGKHSDQRSYGDQGLDEAPLYDPPGDR